MCYLFDHNIHVIVIIQGLLLNYLQSKCKISHRSGHVPFTCHHFTELYLQCLDPHSLRRDVTYETGFMLESEMGTATYYCNPFLRKNGKECSINSLIVLRKTLTFFGNG